LQLTVVNRKKNVDSRMKRVEKYITYKSFLALMMEAASTSETSMNFYQTHGATTQKTAILITVVSTSNISVLTTPTDAISYVFGQRLQTASSLYRPKDQGHQLFYEGMGIGPKL
jgi:hypothetical protein